MNKSIFGFFRDREKTPLGNSEIDIESARGLQSYRRSENKKLIEAKTLIFENTKLTSFEQLKKDNKFIRISI